MIKFGQLRFSSYATTYYNTINLSPSQTYSNYYFDGL